MTPPSLAEAGLRGLCPRCGAPALFDGLLRFAPACRACGLRLETFNVGDGPAAFLTLIVGALIVAAAITVELVFAPPWWVHLVWVPVSLAAVIGSLRVAKALLLVVEYRNRASEARIVGADREGMPDG